jgi:toxin ParE1/3/4
VRIVKSPDAERDLEELGYDLAQHSLAASGRFLTAMERAMDLLAQMPELGSPCNFRRPALRGLRMWVPRRFRRYVIYYRSLPDGIEVIRILHGSQDAERLLAEH